MIENGVVSLLKGTPAIVSICKGFFPSVLPEKPPLPAIVYRGAGLSRNATLNTPSMQRVRLEFECWALAYGDAVVLRDTLLATLDGYQGMITGGASGFLLQNVDLVQMFDLPYDFDALRYGVSIEFYFYFNL